MADSSAGTIDNRVGLLGQCNRGLEIGLVVLNISGNGKSPARSTVLEVLDLVLKVGSKGVLGPGTEERVLNSLQIAKIGYC